MGWVPALPLLLMPPLLCPGSAGEALLSTIQRAAEAVANAVRPGPENPSTQGPLPRGDTYQPAVTPSASHTHPNPGTLILGARGMEARVATLADLGHSFVSSVGAGNGHLMDVVINVDAALTGRSLRLLTRQEALTHFVCLEFLELPCKLRTQPLVS